MKIVEPSFEILQMPDGEAALALLERIGRVAYKSEDKIEPGVPCKTCGGKGMESWGEPFSQTTAAVCPDCSGEGWEKKPSSHKFVRMILKRGRRQQLEKRASDTLGTLLDPASKAGAIVEDIQKELQNNPAHESVIEHCSASVLFRTDRGISHEIVRHRLASYTQVSTRFVRYDGSKESKEISFIGPSGLTETTRMRWIGACQEAEKAYLDLLAGGAQPQAARAVLPNCLMTEIAVTANFREWRHIFRMRCSPAAHPDMRKLMLGTLEEFKRRIPIIFDGIYGE